MTLHTLHRLCLSFALWKTHMSFERSSYSFSSIKFTQNKTAGRTASIRQVDYDYFGVVFEERRKSFLTKDGNGWWYCSLFKNQPRNYQIFQSKIILTIETNSQKNVWTRLCFKEIWSNLFELNDRRIYYWHSIAFD